MHIKAAIGMCVGTFVQPISQKNAPNQAKCPSTPLFQPFFPIFFCLRFFCTNFVIFGVVGGLLCVLAFLSRPRAVLAQSSRCPRVLALSSRSPRAVLAQSSRCPRAVLALSSRCRGHVFVVWCHLSGNFQKIHILCFSGSACGQIWSHTSNSGSCCLFSSRRRDFVKIADVSRANCLELA